MKLLANIFTLSLTVVTILVSAGCRSPYHQDQGALFGGLAGAGVGALIGDKVGDAGAGAAIGAGVGALTGASIGGALDEIEAENRSAIAGQLGRPVQSGAATSQEVIHMCNSGVNSNLVKTYVRQAGVSGPLSAQDVISLHQSGVPADVIQVMQTTGAPQPKVVRRTVIQEPAVIVERPCYGPHHPEFYYHRGHRRHRPHTGFGFTISN